MEYVVISQGKKKAQIVIKHENGKSETRHLLLRNGVWTDKHGNKFEL